MQVSKKLKLFLRYVETENVFRMLLETNLNLFTHGNLPQIAVFKLLV